MVIEGTKFQIFNLLKKKTYLTTYDVCQYVYQ